MAQSFWDVCCEIFASYQSGLFTRIIVSDSENAGRSFRHLRYGVPGAIVVSVVGAPDRVAPCESSGLLPQPPVACQRIFRVSAHSSDKDAADVALCLLVDRLGIMARYAAVELECVVISGDSFVKVLAGLEAADGIYLTVLGDFEATQIFHRAPAYNLNRPLSEEQLRVSYNLLWNGTHREFCDHYGLNVGTFETWRRRRCGESKSEVRAALEKWISLGAPARGDREAIS